MSVLFQIALGSSILVGCTLLHIAVMIWLAQKLRAGQAGVRKLTVQRTFLISSAVVSMLLLSHTTHLYVWALSLWLLGALPSYEEPIYFALVTYTTVGYGDVTLAPPFRIFGAMASVNGILSFGLTTAFLVALIPKIFLALRED